MNYQFEKFKYGVGTRLGFEYFEENPFELPEYPSADSSDDDLSLEETTSKFIELEKKWQKTTAARNDTEKNAAKNSKHEKLRERTRKATDSESRPSSRIERAKRILTKKLRDEMRKSTVLYKNVVAKTPKPKLSNFWTSLGIMNSFAQKTLNQTAQKAKIFGKKMSNSQQNKKIMKFFLVMIFIFIAAKTSLFAITCMQQLIVSGFGIIANQINGFQTGHEIRERKKVQQPS